MSLCTPKFPHHNSGDQYQCHNHHLTLPCPCLSCPQLQVSSSQQRRYNCAWSLLHSNRLQMTSNMKTKISWEINENCNTKKVWKCNECMCLSHNLLQKPVFRVLFVSRISRLWRLYGNNGCQYAILNSILIILAPIISVKASKSILVYYFVQQAINTKLMVSK